MLQETFKIGDKMKIKTIQVYEDSGHGWAKVKRSELTKLGIENEISGYSYERGEYVYLEEDCDLDKYCTALIKLNIKFQFENHHTDRQSKIRGYARYTKTKKVELVSIEYLK